MSATAWVITSLYGFSLLGLAINFSRWWLTSKNEDGIWRWIFSFLGVLLLFTAFWIAYFLGIFNAWGIVIIVLAVTYGWLYVIFLSRSEMKVDPYVFAAFGTMVIGMISLGGYTAGQRGWWGMAIPFYFIALYSIYHLIEPD